MKMKKIIGILLIGIFTVSAAISGYLFFKQYRDAKSSAEAFEDLVSLIQDVETSDSKMPDDMESDNMSPQSETENPNGEEVAVPEAELAYEKYGALYEQNSDFVGWIYIEGTNINYPVMQTPDNPDYYLKHSFERTYSDYGVPYLDEACEIGVSNNLVIYGHHMSNGTMFCDLDGYTDKTFCDAHPIIRFDTLSSFGEYEVIAVFRYNTNREDFRYDKYVTMDEKTFASFIEQVQERQLYSTGRSAEYGDQLLTLSTCEYTYKNGRLVIVARKVVQ